MVSGLTENAAIVIPSSESSPFRHTLWIKTATSLARLHRLDFINLIIEAGGGYGSINPAWTADKPVLLPNCATDETIMAFFRTESQAPTQFFIRMNPTGTDMTFTQSTTSGDRTRSREVRVVFESGSAIVNQVILTERDNYHESPRLNTATHSDQVVRRLLFDQSTGTMTDSRFQLADTGRRQNDVEVLQDASVIYVYENGIMRIDDGSIVQYLYEKGSPVILYRQLSRGSDIKKKLVALFPPESEEKKTVSPNGNESLRVKAPLEQKRETHMHFFEIPHKIEEITPFPVSSWTDATLSGLQLSRQFFYDLLGGKKTSDDLNGTPVLIPLEKIPDPIRQFLTTNASRQEIRVDMCPFGGRSSFQQTATAPNGDKVNRSVNCYYVHPHSPTISKVIIREKWERKKPLETVHGPKDLVYERILTVDRGISSIKDERTYFVPAAKPWVDIVGQPKIRRLQKAKAKYGISKGALAMQSGECLHYLDDEKDNPLFSAQKGDGAYVEKGLRELFPPDESILTLVEAIKEFPPIDTYLAMD